MNSLKEKPLFFFFFQNNGPIPTNLYYLMKFLFPLDLEVGAALQDWSKVYLIISVSNIYKTLTHCSEFCNEMLQSCVFKQIKVLFSCQRAQ